MGSPVFLIWIVLIGAMFYFMMIRPQKRARQTQVDMLQHLQPGAQVRTTAQIMGTVVEVGDDWAIVETTPGTRIKFGKPAIVGIVLEDDETAADADATAESDAADAAAVADAPTPGGIGDAPADAGTGPKADAVPDAKPDAKPEAESDAVGDELPSEATKDAEPAAKP